MPAISQTIPNLFGGVSTQPDFKKNNNQLVDATNVNLDPAFGVTKRHGSKYLLSLGDVDQFKNGKWFFYRRDFDEYYLGVINDGYIRIFNTVTNKEATITASGSAIDYIDSADFNDYRTLTIQDNTIIVNRQKVVEELASTPFVPGLVGTVSLRLIDYSTNYSVTINNQTASFTTRNSDQLDPANTDLKLNASEILNKLKTEIDGLGITGLTVTVLETSIELSSTTPFTLTAVGGSNNEALKHFQDSINNISNVPDRSLDGRIVKIENTTADDDDYYIKYVVADEAWEECKAPGVSPGLDPSTMPHELVSTATDVFEFRPVAYEERLVGDTTTNPAPSFVGKKIAGVFFTNNRLGFLSGPDVILSSTSDYYNFFAKSALTLIDSDPIDVNCNSTVPTDLSYALPVPQGMLLFSTRQQFLMTSGSETLTPNSVFIRQLSNYECDYDIPAVDLGTYQLFITKTSNYSKVNLYQIPEVDQPPLVGDVSKVVTNWIPRTIDTVVSNPESDFILLTDRTSDYIYFFRRYSNGSEDVIQSWYRWQMTGNVITAFTPSNQMFVVTQQGQEAILSVIDLNQSPDNQSVVSNALSANLCIDLYHKITNETYDKLTKLTKIYVPYSSVSDKKGVLVTAQSSAATVKDNSNGWYVEAEGKGSDAFGDYYLFRTNLAGIKDDVIFGYLYDYVVEFPEFYYKTENQSDFTSHLNISRIKFAVGLTGALGFKLQSRGRDDWFDIQPVTEADYYSANTGPLAERFIFNLPIHQRSTNFKIKAFSDLPYPVSMNMVTWEGVYTPKYYRRK